MFDLKGYGPALAEGAVITIELAFLSLALALALGLVGASAKLSGSRVAAGIATAYTTLIRGVPDLVMMLLFYYGGQVAVNMLSDYLWETRGIDFFFQFDCYNIHHFFDRCVFEDINSNWKLLPLVCLGRYR